MRLRHTPPSCDRILTCLIGKPVGGDRVAQSGPGGGGGAAGQRTYACIYACILYLSLVSFWHGEMETGRYRNPHTLPRPPYISPINIQPYIGPRRRPRPLPHPPALSPILRLLRTPALGVLFHFFSFKHRCADSGSSQGTCMYPSFCSLSLFLMYTQTHTDTLPYPFPFLRC